MPHQNRVTPVGEIVAVPERGALMGNRGILHDDDERPVRSWQVRRWIVCRTAFRGRRRQLLRPLCGRSSSFSTRRQRSPLAVGPAPSVAMPTISVSRPPEQRELEL
jgi:hypothetical protein